MTMIRLTGSADRLAAAIEHIQRSLEPLTEVVAAVGRQAEVFRLLAADPLDEEFDRG